MKKQPSIAVNFTPRGGQGAKSDLPETYLLQSFSPALGEAPQELNFNRLRGRPTLTQSIARYVRVTNAKNAPSTRSKALDRFRYFYAFLESWEDLFGNAVASVDEIDQRILDGYADWLDGKRSVGSVLDIEGRTKNQRYNQVRRLLEWSRGNDGTRLRGSKALRFHLPWPEKKTEPKPLKLSHVDISRLFIGCKVALTSTAEKLELGLSVSGDTRIIVPDLREKSIVPFLDFKVKLKSSHEAMRINLMSGRFREEMPGLARAVRPNYGTVEEIIDHLHLTTDTMIPFLILIGLPTCFNEVGLLSLRWSHVQQREGLLGGQRVYLNAKKRRTGYPQNRSFALDDDPFSVGNLLKQLKKFTRLTHELSSGRFEDFVFLPFRRRGGGARPLWDGRSADTAVVRSLVKFREGLVLPHFTLNDLRTIGGDVASEMSRGDLIIQQIIQRHQTPATTDKHYTTDRQFWQGQENLAHAMNERGRITSSQGKVDTRNQGGRTRRYSAATPGFDCDDPNDSPISGQRRGSLCDAYAKCFACPLSSIRKSARSAARLLQFAQAFNEAAEKMNSARWTVEWRDQQRALNSFWLPQFDPELLAKADVRSLPPVPPIE
ncbi:hypothetical protein [Agrobacterium rubi]|uniref:Integrase n=1 Tax=Agrobacterium rubi TaxID=28099 RepID=A0AAE7URH5_9HYPH|nr:hypothetical protein [Agrobacterium rubi]NTE86110.1 hypothetical protein [Agrobacterium rubi]NTF02041.1 hypothetical protein [Agrobacterium rubi]NTF36285.1 hypothetical protein [Agrobacterium rubi]OCJ54554.1 hypothetical protein A6U92_21090 [Agrobacterium rubi]QTG01362.1 hypothetical protein G6M88_13620 [Agrobacterium rubi]